MKVSVIIPCYNDGTFLKEAVLSVLNCSYKNIELIIVNDGSTDLNTLKILEEYEREGLKVISHPNTGLGYSRNAGIKEAKGKYILPLDADNKIGHNYIEKAVTIMENNSVDIVYGKPTFFGDEIPSRYFTTHEFDGQKLFQTNYIDACATYRKTVWEKVGGYETGMPVPGNEDWEFWVNSFVNGYTFKFLNEETFFYRVRENSMISGVNDEKHEINHNYILLKHKKAILGQIENNRRFQKFFEKDQKNYLRTSLKYFIKFFRKII